MGKLGDTDLSAKGCPPVAIMMREGSVWVGEEEMNAQSDRTGLAAIKAVFWAANQGKAIILVEGYLSISVHVSNSLIRLQCKTSATHPMPHGVDVRHAGAAGAVSPRLHPGHAGPHPVLYPGKGTHFPGSRGQSLFTCRVERATGVEEGCSRLCTIIEIVLIGWIRYWSYYFPYIGNASVRRFAYDLAREAHQASSPTLHCFPSEQTSVALYEALRQPPTTTYDK
jgi:hypothetical protein